MMCSGGCLWVPRRATHATLWFRIPPIPTCLPSFAPRTREAQHIVFKMFVVVTQKTPQEHTSLSTIQSNTATQQHVCFAAFWRTLLGMPSPYGELDKNEGNKHEWWWCPLAAVAMYSFHNRHHPITSAVAHALQPAFALYWPNHIVERASFAIFPCRWMGNFDARFDEIAGIIFVLVAHLTLRTAKSYECMRRVIIPIPNMLSTKGPHRRFSCHWSVRGRPCVGMWCWGRSSPASIHVPLRSLA